jgi:hypothetical protein
MTCVIQVRHGDRNVEPKQRMPFRNRQVAVSVCVVVVVGGGGGATGGRESAAANADRGGGTDRAGGPRGRANLGGQLVSLRTVPCLSCLPCSTPRLLPQGVRLSPASSVAPPPPPNTPLPPPTTHTHLRVVHRDAVLPRHAAGRQQRRVAPLRALQRRHVRLVDGGVALGRGGCGFHRGGSRSGQRGLAAAAACGGRKGALQASSQVQAAAAGALHGRRRPPRRPRGQPPAVGGTVRRRGAAAGAAFDGGRGACGSGGGGQAVGGVCAKGVVKVWIQHRVLQDDNITTNSNAS